MRVKKVTGILLFCCFNQDIASDIIRLRLRRPIPEEIRRIYHLRIFSEVCTCRIAVFPISRRGIFLRNTFQIDEMICADSILLLNFGECPVSFGSDILVCFLWI